MNTINIMWQIFNTLGILVIAFLIYLFAKWVKSYAKQQGKKSRKK